MSKVFPVQKTKFILESAEDFGIVQDPLFEDFAYPASKSRQEADEKKEKFLLEVEEKLKTYNPETDYLMLVGDPIFIGLAFMEVLEILLDMNRRTFKVLRYDKNLNRYIDIEVIV